LLNILLIASFKFDQFFFWRSCAKSLEGFEGQMLLATIKLFFNSFNSRSSFPSVWWISVQVIKVIICITLKQVQISSSNTLLLKSLYWIWFDLFTIYLKVWHRMTSYDIVIYVRPQRALLVNDYFVLLPWFLLQPFIRSN